MSDWKKRATVVDGPPRSGSVGQGESVHEAGAAQPVADDPSYVEKMIRALAHGGRKGAVLGADEEAGGFLQALMQARTVGMPEELKRKAGVLEMTDANNNPLTPLEVFRVARDGNVREEARVRGASPGAYFIGNMAAGAALPMGQAKTLKDVLLLGAGTGGAMGLMDSDADLTRGQFFKAAKDTGTGALFGAGGGAVGLGIGKAAPTLLRLMRSKFEDTAIDAGRKALQGGSSMVDAGKKPLADAAVKEALDRGAIIPFGTVQGAAKRLGQEADNLGTVYGELLDELERQGVPGAEVRATADRLLQRAAETELTTGASKAVPNRYFSEAKNVENMSLGQPNLPLSRAEAIKRDLQAQARGDYVKSGRAAPMGDARMEIAAIVREANEEAVEKAAAGLPIGHPAREAADAFVPVKSSLSKVISARDVAERAANKAANRKGIGLQDSIMGGAAVAGGGGFSGAALMVAINKLLASRGASTVASTAYGLSRGARTLAELAQRNATALPGAAARLLTAGERAALGRYLTGEEP